MSIVERARNIILKPKEEWEVIRDEPASLEGLFKNYVAILAAIPAVAGFIGSSIFGVRLAGQTFRVDFATGIGQAIIGYVLTFVLIYLIAFAIDRLADNFSAQANRTQALKVAVYSGTPGWVGGIFALIPALSWVALLAGLYGIYVLYLGLTALMAAPKDKAAVYTGAVVLAYVVIAIVFGVLTGAVVGSGTGFG